MNICASLPPAEQFRVAMLERLGAAPADVIADGRMHRFPTSKKKRDTAGWYVFFMDGIPAGEFGDWRTDIRHKWCAKRASEMSPAEKKQFAQQSAERERKAAEIREQTARNARSRWDSAKPASESHPYLRAKCIGAYGIRVSKGWLLIPVTSDGETIVSLQTIDGNGTKRFLTGGRMKGCFAIVGEPGDTVVIAEGYATAASIHRVSGCAVIVAFNAGNLAPVAKAIREKFLSARIIIAADDDYETDGNPGLILARKAAAEVGGTIAIPPFDRDAGETGTDWNDFAAVRGSNAMAEAFRISTAENAEPSPERESDLPASVTDGNGNDGPFPREFSEDALALHFAKIHANDLRYVASWGKWLSWTGTYWRFDDTLHAFDLCRKVCRAAAAHSKNPKVAPAIASAKTVAAIERLTRADRRIAATTDQWDPDPWLLNTPGGICDLRTGSLRPHQLEDYCTKIAAVTPGGNCPRFLGFLERIMAGEAESSCISPSSPRLRPDWRHARAGAFLRLWARREWQERPTFDNLGDTQIVSENSRGRDLHHKQQRSSPDGTGRSPGSAARDGDRNRRRPTLGRKPH